MSTSTVLRAKTNGPPNRKDRRRAKRRAATGRGTSAELERGIRFQQAGDLDRAAACYQRILAHAPNDPNALHLLGLVAERKGDLDTAALLIGRVADAHPDFAPAQHNLGNVLTALGRPVEAEASFRRALRLSPGLAAAHLGLGTVLQAQERLDEAIACYRRAIAADPMSADAYNNLGSALEAQGDFDAAAAEYERALAADPGHALTHMNLVAARRVQADDEIIPRLEALTAEDGRPPADRMLLHYALGKCFDDTGDADRAFRHVRQANEIQGRARPFDMADHACKTGLIIDTFTPELFAAKADIGDPDARPIFIVGMPRSGTTLVEQILASHPRVRAGGERRFVTDLVNGFSTRTGIAEPYPAGVAMIDDPTAARVTRAYLDGVGADCGDGVRVTDKMPQNFRHLGLIALLFPRAVVIHCRRDPLDVGLSCYFQNFEKLPFTNDLDTLGRFIRDYERLMAHWRAVLPLEILDLPYENLVADTEAVTRRIVAVCGLAWNDACLDFHRTERTVTTASLWQVRQPVYTSSVGRWRRYEDHLAPLRAALDRTP